MDTVNIYADGACKGNPGPGGYGAILVCRGYEKIIRGGEPDTTNNRMELLGAICAFEALSRPCNVIFCSDSKYVIDGLSKGWAVSWKKKGWKKSDGKPALNPELWDRLLAAVQMHNVTYEWIKGHNGHEYNERCDAIACEEASRFQA